MRDIETESSYALMPAFDTNTWTTFAPLIYCVIDHAVLQATPDIDHTLLQYISVMNLSPYSHCCISTQIL